MAKVVAIIAGGTGGHVIPALSIAAALTEKGYEIVWLGSEHGIEQKLVPNVGYPLFTIPIYKLNKKSLKSWLEFPLALRTGIAAAKQVFRRYKPVLVIGMGSYISVPGALAAKRCGIPLVLHEQNAIPGQANKLLSRFARRVLSAFPNAFEASKKVFHTGNPIRQKLLGAPLYKARTQDSIPLKVLIVGGSQGASVFNKIVPNTISRFEIGLRPRVWHQVRSEDIDSVRAAYRQHNIDARVEPYIEDMSAAYHWADVVIARSGAMTVSEIMAIGMPSILVPYPWAKDNHQYYNAKMLADEGASILMEQNKFDEATLYQHLKQLTQMSQRLLQMSNAAKSLGKREATTEVVSHCIEVISVSN